MSDSPAHAFVQFCQTLNTRTFFAFVLVVAVVIAIFLGFESYTSHFAVARTAQEVEIVKSLVDLRTASTLTPEEEQIRLSLLRRFAPVPETAQSLPSQNYHWFSRFMWGILPWSLIALIGLLTTQKDRGAFLGGITVVGCASATLTLFVPNGDFWWTAFVVPWGTFAAVIATIMLIGLLAVQKARVKHANNATQEKSG